MLKHDKYFVDKFSQITILLYNHIDSKDDDIGPFPSKYLVHGLLGDHPLNNQ